MRALRDFLTGLPLPAAWNPRLGRGDAVLFLLYGFASVYGFLALFGGSTFDYTSAAGLVVAWHPQKPTAEELLALVSTLTAYIGKDAVKRNPATGTQDAQAT